MKCPKCKKAIDQVNILGEYWQKAEVDKKGEITNYGSVEELTDILKIECRDCYADLTKIIKE